ncbi:MAG: hypothetical protein ACYDHB_10165 [Candidatus Dormibacteria bacterium]
MTRFAMAAALSAAALALAACTGLPAFKPPAPTPVKLTAAERSAVSAMQDSAGIQFCKTPTVVAAARVRAYDT